MGPRDDLDCVILNHWDWANQKTLGERKRIGERGRKEKVAP